MDRLILADNQAIFRTGAARLLILDDNISIIAQCDDLQRLASAVEAFRGAVILLASTLCADLRGIIAKAHSMDSRVILITENAEVIDDETAQLLDGLLCRSIAGIELIDCVRRVGRGQRCVQRTSTTSLQAADTVGTRVRDRLTP